jgi:transglutaminase-like putative cysteine protease
MSKRQILSLVFLAVFLCTAGLLSAQVTSDFSLVGQPVVNIPLGPWVNSQVPLYAPVGGGVSIKAEYTLPFFQMIYTGLVFDADWIPTNGYSSSLISLSLGPELGFQFFPIQRFGIRVAGYGGLYMGMVTGATVRNPFAVGLVDFDYLLNPALSLGAGVQYRANFYPQGIAYQGIGVSLGARWHMGASSRGEIRVTPEILPVFPLFYSFYDKNPVGTVLIKNEGQGPIENLTVSFSVKEFMDQAKITQVGQVRRGEEIKASIYALFNHFIFDVTEGKKVAGELTVSYRYLGNDFIQPIPISVTVYNRNAMTWDNTNSAAAFVTAKDPDLLVFAKKTAADAKSRATPAAANSNFRVAMALFQAMGVHGIGYAPDPNSSYANQSENKSAIDYLQFPAQTFTYKGGDCDDLSILYSALLESVGIPTAFITIPGHIYMAFALEMKGSEANATFARPDDLIIQENGVWVPVEITRVKDGFLRAWKEGAQEWRTANANGSALFYPIHEAWKTYEPVGEKVVKSPAAPPDSERVFSSFSAELNAFVAADMKPRAADLQKQLAADPENVKLMTKLGVLYARFGMLKEAQDQFMAVTKKTSDVPSSILVNLGNISYLTSKYTEALGYFRQALQKTPDSVPALLGLLLSAYEMGEKETVNVTYQALKKVDPESAKKYEYMSSEGASSGRAASAEREVTLWGNEE